MSTHNTYSPSSAHRWIACPGSMAWPDNIGDGESSVYADDGTASHNLGARTLQSGVEDCSYFLGTVSRINGVDYVNDEERCDYVQVYVDKVRQLAIGGVLFIEHKVVIPDLTDGTADAGIIQPELVCATDLKYGIGERVDASYIGPDGKKWPNEQLGLYAYGLVLDARMLGHDPKKALLCIVQPRLDHIDEFECSVADLEALVERAKKSQAEANTAITLSPKDPRAVAMMHPGVKQCRWCRGVDCKAREQFIAAQVRCDFDTIDEANEPVAPVETEDLSAAGRALPLIMQWCRAVQAAISERVAKGVEVIGIDNKPLKFVEGEQGDRKWIDEAAAEAALLAHPLIGPEKAYAPRKVLSAPKAAKILDRKATKAQWKEQFAPMIKRAPGRPVLALGSDPRPPYHAASVNDFESAPDIGADE